MPKIDLQKIIAKCPSTYDKIWDSFESRLYTLLQERMEEAAANGESSCEEDLEYFIDKFEDDIAEEGFDYFCEKIEKEMREFGIKAFMDSTHFFNKKVLPKNFSI